MSSLYAHSVYACGTLYSILFLCGIGGFCVEVAKSIDHHILARQHQTVEKISDGCLNYGQVPRNNSSVRSPGTFGLSKLSAAGGEYPHYLSNTMQLLSEHA